MAVGPGEILDRLVDGAVELDQWAHNVVDRLKKVRMVGWPPSCEREDVVPRIGLGFGLNRH